MAFVANMPEDSLVHGLLGRLAEESEPQPRVSKLRQQLFAASAGDTARLRKTG